MTCNRWNFTKTCFVRDYVNHTQQVVWNITFHGPNTPDVSDENIQMQTKDLHEKNWHTLQICKRQKNSIECNLDESFMRFKYHLRLYNPSKLIYYVHEVNEGHYQNGLLCYPNHGIINFTANEVMKDHVTVSWCFYDWDLKNHFMQSVKVKVYASGVKYIENRIPINANTKRSQLFNITGLNACENYKIVVSIDYDLDHTRNTFLLVKTKCPADITSLEKAIIVVSCIVVVMAMCFLGYILRQQKQQESSLKSTDDSDIIDQRTLLKSHNSY